MTGSGKGRWLLCVLCLLSSAYVAGAPATEAAPVIAIIIDDLGNGLAEGEQTIALPGPVACAFLPHTPHAAELARRAHSAGKEVLLHLPLQAVAHNNLLGPGALTLEESERQFRTTLRHDLAAIPHVQGVNNHMGSLLTRHPGAMAWLMSELAAHGGLFFVDSYTTVQSVALQLADENQVPAARRDVFLDDDADPAAIRFQFQRLLDIAQRQGYAIAIGHPHPNTLAVLREELARLPETGVTLVPVQTLIQQREADKTPWPVSSSRLPTAAKSLKPSP